MKNRIDPGNFFKQLLFLAAIMCSYGGTKAQLPDFKWKYIFDGYNTVWLADLVVDSKGNTYVGVNYTSQLSLPGLEKQKLPHPGHVHSLIVKIDTTGKAVWAHPFKSSFDNRVNDLALAPNGDLLVTGFGDGQMHFPGSKDTPKLGNTEKNLNSNTQRLQ